MENKQKLLIIITHADDDPERATLAFTLASGAIAMDVEPVIVLQAQGVMLALEGYAEHIHNLETEPLKKLMDTYLAEGYKLHICTACMKKRKIKSEQLIKGTVEMGAGKIIELMFDCERNVRY